MDLKYHRKTRLLLPQIVKQKYLNMLRRFSSLGSSSPSIKESLLDYLIRMPTKQYLTPSMQATIFNILKFILVQSNVFLILSCDELHTNSDCGTRKRGQVVWVLFGKQRS